jgi:TPR repeat protein
MEVVIIEKNETVIEKKIKQINQTLTDSSLSYVYIPDCAVDIIYDLFVNHIKCDNIDSINNDVTHYYYGVIYFYYGVYYRYIKKDYEQAVSYYLLAIEKENDCAMNNLALYYERKVNNIELAIKYYLMAIERGNSTAMNNLAIYYCDNRNNKNNEELAVKYFLMAIENGYKNSTDDLLSYCEDEKNCESVIKYYLSTTNVNICLHSKMINGVLKKKFDIELAIRMYKHLDRDNTYTIDNIIYHTLL